MRRATWLWLAAAGCAAPAACTFGADDFNVVAGSSGGDEASGGVNDVVGNHPAGGNDTTRGEGGMAGAAAPGGPGAGGAAGSESETEIPTGGAGGEASTITLACANRGQKLTIFSEADVADQDFDRVVLVTSGDNAFAVATTSENMGNGQIAVRRLTDSMNNAVAELRVFAIQGHFSFGGAYAGPLTLHVIGADQRGVIDVGFALDTRGQLEQAVMPVVLQLETPDACKSLPGLSTGSVRDIRAAFDGELNYVVTCQTGNDTDFSMHLRRADRSLVELQGTSNPLSSLIRQYVHSSDGTSLLATGDEFGTTTELRYGKTDRDLNKPHQLTVDDSGDPTLFQSALMLPLADNTGTFFIDATLHDPEQGSVAPATLYGGTFKVADYPEFANVPPKPFRQMVRYTKSADIVLPSDGAVRANDVLLVASDPVGNSGIYAWMIDLTGRARSDRLTVSEGGGSVDNPHGVQVGSSFMVAWREMGATTTILGRPIGCF